MTHIEQLIQDMCPNGVEFKTLGEVCKMKRGSTITANQAEDGDIPVIAGGQKPAYFHNQCNRDGKNITVAGSGAYAGYVAYWEQPIFVSDAFTVTPKDASLDIKFLYYFLTNIQDKIYHTKKGSGVPHVHPSSIADFEIPLPPLEIQERIVAILDRFSALAAELQAELHLRRKQYEYYRTQLLTPHSDCNSADKTDDCKLDSQGYTKGIAKVYYWQWKTLGEVCEIKNGKDYKHLNDGQFPVYGSGGVMTYKDQFVYDKPSVLLPRKGSINKIHYVDEPFWNVDTAFYTIIDEEQIMPKYLFHYLSTITLETYNTGTGSIPSLTQTVLKSIPIAFPPLAEQERIVSILDKFEALTTSLSDGIPAEQAAQQKRYEYYRDLLLTFDRKEV